MDPMLRRNHPCLPMAALLLCAVFPGLSCSPRPSGGLVAVGATTVDLGSYPAWESRVARYRIRNEGAGPVRMLRTHCACACATTRCDRAELAPGAEATVEVTILPHSIAGAFSKPVYVQSTDALNPLLNMTVAGQAVPLVTVGPSDFIHAGRIPTQTAWQTCLTLAATRPGVSLGTPQSICNVPASVELKPTAGPGPLTASLDLRLLPVSYPAGLDWTVRIPVLTPSNHPPVQIGITGKIGPELIAMPGTFRVSRRDLPSTHRILLRLVGGQTGMWENAEVLFPGEKGLSFDVVRNGTSEPATRAVDMVIGPEFAERLQTSPRYVTYIAIPNAMPARLVFVAAP